MEAKQTSKTGEAINENTYGGLSYGLAKVEGKSLDSKPSIIWDFLTQSFLFVLGGVILCGLLYALVTYI